MSDLAAEIAELQAECARRGCSLIGTFNVEWLRQEWMHFRPDSVAAEYGELKMPEITAPVIREWIEALHR